ncbi:type III secretion system outer membrane ring subunit SctC [Mitsuaria sp. GD03876]|uniref:type III secretion system outer membrane ring subunit SctC n=1 Tax=Mitsuaria sp. GD03876 TaxID=2975399 RepID=UPI00244A4F01|nr:type III secretion system outer membrane ring subunit SctC [Mitsuaria sp. GD03876]MDH0865336.1 type III secretion system outer membrane ring subunit SctC [Mitsuaria sp. GD03876]
MRHAATHPGALLRVAFLAAALAGPLGPATREAAAVAPAAWREMLYSYRADGDRPLSEALTHFTSTLGLELKLSTPALGRRVVHLGGKGVSPAVFLDRLADEEGLDWFVYQGVLHVSARSAATSERISLGPQSPSDAKEALVGLGLFESRFGWGEFDTDPPTALVSGPPAYVALVKALLAVPDDVSARRERPRLMVFRLRHASAADREMRTRDRSVTLPGLVSTLNQVLPGARSLNPRARPAGGQAIGADSWSSGDGDPWAGLTKVLGNDAGDLAAGLSGLPAANLPLAPAQRRGAPTATATPTGAATSSGGGPSALTAPEAGSGRMRHGAERDANHDVVPSITAYTPLNAILVWDLPSRREEYRALIDELDVPSRLVEINVTILDVKANALRDWSVDLNVGSGAAHVQLGAGGGSDVPGIGAGDTGVNGSTMSLWASDRLAVRLRALEAHGQAQVLSRPSVLTMNNVGALLDMNQSTYVKLIGERATDLRTITAGMLLKVTPSIVGDGGGDATAQGIRVTLDIEDGQLSQASSASASPGVENSAVSTEALVRPGESLVVGGYRRQNRQVSNRRVPGLSSVPILGALFRSDGAIHDERERLFILTARALP